MTNKNTLDKWNCWLNVIKADVQDLLVTRRMMSELRDIIQANPALPSTSEFYGHLKKTYTSHMLMGVRRQTKAKQESISLAGLLLAMMKEPQHLSRRHFQDLYQNSVIADLADAHFDQLTSDGALHIDAAVIESDLARLKQASKKCEDVADRRVAHRDRKEPSSLPTYTELDDVVSLLDELCIKYLLLVHGSSYETLLPTRQYDWLDVFRMAWIPQETSTG